MEELAKSMPQYFVKTSDEWVRYVHNRETRNYAFAYSALHSMIKKQNQESSSSADAKSQYFGKKPQSEAAKFFQKIIFDNVTAGNEKLKASIRCVEGGTKKKKLQKKKKMTKQASFI